MAFITAPTANSCVIWNHDLSSWIHLYDLMEPTIFPELQSQVRSNEYWTRPGTVTGGNRVWAVWPARDNYAEIPIEVPYCTLADANTLKSWQENNPPVVHFTNDGGITVYKCLFMQLMRKPFKYFQRAFYALQIQLQVLGSIGTIEVGD